MPIWHSSLDIAGPIPNSSALPRPPEGPPTPSRALDSSHKGKERRRHPRVSGKNLPLKLLGRGGEAYRIRDVSSAGVAFYSEEPVPVMTRVGFAIEFPASGGPGEARHASGEGVVVRCERLSRTLSHYEVAVFFGDLEDDAARLIQRYVDRHLKEAARD